MEIEKEVLHELVKEYLHDYCGEEMGSSYLHEQIDDQTKRDDNFNLFLEWALETNLSPK